MNQTIRLLAEQADIYINKSNCAESGNGTEIIGWHIEKFAEILIFECTKIAVFKGDAATAKAIKEHFAL